MWIFKFMEFKGYVCEKKFYYLNLMLLKMLNMFERELESKPYAACFWIMLWKEATIFRRCVIFMCLKCSGISVISVKTIKILRSLEQLRNLNVLSSYWLYWSYVSHTVFQVVLDDTNKPLQYTHSFHHGQILLQLEK